MQTSVKTLLHTASETKLDYCMKKAHLDMNMIQGTKSIYGRCTCALCFGS